ncbi:hypothetical protein [Chitinophaga sancti]|uniref:hypothetical protein n=1 Tax=Chitinophaga sancti TaxID=1004 RepID=UPI003F7A66B4
MEQHTIFDKDFDAKISIRRRDLMPGWLKVYVWAGMIIGIFMMVGLMATICYLWSTEGVNGSWVTYLTYVLFMVTVFSFFLKYYLMWVEAKQAILWNIFIGIVWLIITQLVLWLNFMSWVVFLEVLIPIPYWIVLFRIKYKWEHVAIAGKK